MAFTDYKTTAAENTTLWAEGMAPSQVNDSGRTMQSDLRSALAAVVPNLSAARAVSVFGGYLLLAGSATVGDIVPRLMYWNNDSSATDDSQYSIQPTSIGSGNGRWLGHDPTNQFFVTSTSSAVLLIGKHYNSVGGFQFQIQADGNYNISQINSSGSSDNISFLTFDRDTGWNIGTGANTNTALSYNNSTLTLNTGDFRVTDGIMQLQPGVANSNSFYEAQNLANGGIQFGAGTSDHGFIYQIGTSSTVEATWMTFARSGGVTIYANDTPRFATNTSGVKIEGTLSASSSAVFDNSVVVGQTLQVNNTVTIDQNSNAIGLSIDSEATTQPAIYTPGNTHTSGDIIQIDSANALTTGGLINAISNSASTSSRNLLQIINDNTLATGAICLNLQQDSIAAALTINSAGTTTGNIIEVVNADSLSSGRCARFHSNSSNNSSRNLLQVDNANAAATGAVCLNLVQSSTNKVIAIASPGCTTQYVMELINCDSLTSAGILYLHSNSSSGSSRNLINLINDNSSAGGTRLMRWQQDANATVVQCNSPACSTEIVFDLVNCDSLTTGSIIRAYSGSSSTSTRDLVSISQAHGSATNARCIGMTQQADAPYINFAGASGGTSAFPITTLTNSGATTHHVKVAIGGTDAWMAVSTNAPT